MGVADGVFFYHLREYVSLCKSFGDVVLSLFVSSIVHRPLSYYQLASHWASLANRVQTPIQ
jgi:hypothetical protein